MRKILFFLLFACTSAFAQVSTAPPLLNYKGTTLPTNCAVGRLFFKTDASAGGQIYTCSAANTWTQITGSSGGGSVVVASGKTVTFNNTITYNGTDATTMTFPATSATIARTDAGQTFTGHQTIEGVTSTGATGTGKLVFDGIPTLVTPVIGAATGTSLVTSGAVVAGTNLQAASNIQWSNGTALTSAASGVVAIQNNGGTAISTISVPVSGTHQWGVDSATPAAQIAKFADVIAGTTNTAGVNATIQCPAGTGTGAGGSCIFQVAPAGSTGSAKNAWATALTITSTGAATFANTVTASNNVQGGNLISGGQMWFTAKSVFTSPSDGILELSNQAQNDFNRLQLGGTTASFPAIKRSAATLQFRLADDSGNADFVAANASLSGTVSAAGGTFSGTIAGNAASQTIASGLGQAVLTSTTSQAADLGSSMVFGLAYTGTTTANLASISARKENGSDGNYAAYMAFATTPNGGSPTERMRISSAGAVTMPALASSSAAQTGTVCWTTGTGNLTVDTTTTCLLSGSQFKERERPLGPSLSTVLSMKPKAYYLKDEFNPTGLGEQVGFFAQDVVEVEPRLVSFESDGVTPHAVRYQQYSAVLTKAMQELYNRLILAEDRITMLERKLRHGRSY